MKQVRNLIIRFTECETGQKPPILQKVKLRLREVRHLSIPVKAQFTWDYCKGKKTTNAKGHFTGKVAKLLGPLRPEGAWRHGVEQEIGDF